MTKFDCYIEKMQERRQAEAEKRINEWLYQSVTNRQKAEVLDELINGLFFRVKTVVSLENEKALC